MLFQYQRRNWMPLHPEHLGVVGPDEPGWNPVLQADLVEAFQSREHHPCEGQRETQAEKGQHKVENAGRDQLFSQESARAVLGVVEHRICHFSR